MRGGAESLLSPNQCSIEHRSSWPRNGARWQPRAQALEEDGKQVSPAGAEETYTRSLLRTEPSSSNY